MDDIAVSVVIITYKHENYIRQCLDSVFMQKTNFNFEVIVGEDASPDNTRAILLEYKEKYGDKLVLVLHDKNLGPSGNSRSIQKLVRGRYIASVEGDDFWTDENKLQRQYDVLENNPQYSAVGCNFIDVDCNGNLRRNNVMKISTDEVKTMYDWIHEGYTVHTCTVLRRNILPIHDEKYIKLKTAKPTMGDMITFTLLYDAGDIYVIKDEMAAHRAAGKNDTSSFSFQEKKDPLKYVYMYKDIIDLLDEYLEHKYDFTPKVIDKVARVKLRKILRQATYSVSEMNKFLSPLGCKFRIKANLRLLYILARGVKRKVLRKNGKK